jgi:hypothetical protein
MEAGDSSFFLESASGNIKFDLVGNSLIATNFNLAAYNKNNE